MAAPVRYGVTLLAVVAIAVRSKCKFQVNVEINLHTNVELDARLAAAAAHVDEAEDHQGYHRDDEVEDDVVHGVDDRSPARAVEGHRTNSFEKYLKEAKVAVRRLDLGVQALS